MPRQTQARAAVTVQKVNSNVYRLVEGESVVALALRLASGRWRLTDCNGQFTASDSHDTPQAVAKAFNAPAAPAAT